ncbi:hypothetical protein ACJX0J_010081, partial [Zea mays]
MNAYWLNGFKGLGASQIWQGLHKDTWMGEDEDVLVVDCFDGDNGWIMGFHMGEIQVGKVTIDHIFFLLPVGELCLELRTPRLVEDIFSIDDVMNSDWIVMFRF